MHSTVSGAATTTREEFNALAAVHRVVPVTRKVLADSETPLSAYRKLGANRPGTFLLESAENGRSWSRWSFIGAGSPSALTVRDGQSAWLGATPEGAPVGGDPLDALRATMDLLAGESLAGLPPLSGGMVGFLAYDIVRRLEKLPELAADDLGLPDLLLLLATDMAAVDHHEGTITLIANAVNWDDTPERVAEAYDGAVARLDVMTAALGQPLPSTVAHFDRPAPTYRSQRTVQEYSAIVDKLVGDIEAGEAFQVVPSMRFEMETDVDPLEVYRILRVTNPSPYMYLLHAPDSEGGTAFSIVGSSPEALVTVQDGVATTHPIAGTRWRGATDEEDLLLAKDLLADEKELSEHLMLVDLGRNDLGRVCTPGSVKVSDYSHIERYSHVMHLVSTVSGSLADGKTALDAITACFPAGTLSGAPKVRAMELIEEVELTRRGLYGGVLGYLDFAGNADFAIAIRTALFKDGRAYVQAGGGVVADSTGEYEYNEARNKATAVLNAIAAAETLTGAADVCPRPAESGPPALAHGCRAARDRGGSVVGCLEVQLGPVAFVRRPRRAQNTDGVGRRLVCRIGSTCRRTGRGRDRHARCPRLGPACLGRLGGDHRRSRCLSRCQSVGGARCRATCGRGEECRRVDTGRRRSALGRCHHCRPRCRGIGVGRHHAAAGSTRRLGVQVSDPRGEALRGRESGG